MQLDHLGWTPRLDAAFEPHRSTGLSPARVCRADRDLQHIMHSGGTSPAVIAGRLRHEAKSAAELPAVGDWVAVQLPDGDAPAVIHAVLPRHTRFSRNDVAGTTEEQVVAANVDVLFLVCGLDGDFNLRRIERYLEAAWNSGAVPVVVLNKADLCDDVEARVDEVAAIAPGVDVYAVSAVAGDGMDALRPHLLPGRTVALLGMSGVGKSTLVNALLGEERQATQAVREWDQRGRHTTTRRELIPLPDGALLLDTPGMRVLQLWGDGDGASEAFADVEALAARCRFGDCAHASEPGCAVRAALHDGTLDPARHASWVKLQRERRAFAARHDVRLQREQKTRWKNITKANRARPRKGW